MTHIHVYGQEPGEVQDLGQVEFSIDVMLEAALQDGFRLMSSLPLGYVWLLEDQQGNVIQFQEVI